MIVSTQHPVLPSSRQPTSGDLWRRSVGGLIAGCVLANAVQAADGVNLNTNLFPASAGQAGNNTIGLAAAADTIGRTQQVFKITEEQLRQIVTQVIEQRQLTNSTTADPHKNDQNPFRQWWLAQQFAKIQDKFESIVGWNVNQIVTTVSAAMVGFWLLAGLFGKRHRFEFSTYLTDLRLKPSGLEEYEPSTVLGRQEIDGLIGKPKDLKSILGYLFLPRSWSFFSAQRRAQDTPEFPAFRFSSGSRILDALRNYIAISSLDLAVVRHSNRDAHLHLQEEVARLDGPEAAKKLHPVCYGEDMLVTMTYERYEHKVNRALIISAKDLCSLLANPSRYIDAVLNKYDDFKNPTALGRLNLDLIRLTREIEVALSVMEHAPHLISRYVQGHGPNTWAEIEQTARDLRPITTLGPEESQHFLCRYAMRLEDQGAVNPLNSEWRTYLRSKKEVLLPLLAGKGVDQPERKFGETTQQEERRIRDLWYQPPALKERLRVLIGYVPAALRAVFTKATWAEVRPKPPQREPYDWFRVISAPDPNI